MCIINFYLSFHTFVKQESSTSYKNLMLLVKRWSSLLGIVFGVGGLLGCGAGVLLHPNDEGGGVVQYVFRNHDGHLLSPNRTDALHQIRQYCHGAYLIRREGPTRGRKRVVEGVAGTDVVTENWWGIEFDCQARLTSSSRSMSSQVG